MLIHLKKKKLLTAETLIKGGKTNSVHIFLLSHTLHTPLISLRTERKTRIQRFIVLQYKNKNKKRRFY